MDNSQQNERIFALFDNWDFFTGVTKDGEQVLMGLLCPLLVAFFFTQNGSLIMREIRPWNYPAPERNNRYNIYDKEFEKNLELQFSEWKNEIGFQSATLQLKAFFDEEYPVGIEEAPAHLKGEYGPYSPFLQWLYNVGEIPAEVVAKGLDHKETPEECQERELELKNWIESGSFVFWWGKDYWISKDGEIKAT